MKNIFIAATAVIFVAVAGKYVVSGFSRTDTTAAHAAQV